MTGALNTAIVTIMLVVTTPMVPVQLECVQQDGEHIHAAKNVMVELLVRTAVLPVIAFLMSRVII